MTDEQFERWKDFALRMARTCFKRQRNPSSKAIEENVNFFFECLNPDDKLSIVDWDHSKPYPKSSRSYARTYRTVCWHCKGSKRNDCPYACEDGQIFDYAIAQCVTDQISELSDHFNPYYWHDLSEREHDRRDDQFVGPVRCCIRAGLDLAVSPSMGVMGFTAGDLRKMYPEGVPDWITGGPKKRWKTQKFDGVVPGVGLIPGKSVLSVPFAKMPDDAHVWL